MMGGVQGGHWGRGRSSGSIRSEGGERKRSDTAYNDALFIFFYTTRELSSHSPSAHTHIRALAAV